MSDQESETRTAPRRRTRRAGHIFDRLRVVRNHWLTALLAFALIFGFILYRALHSRPTYQAGATITIAGYGTGSILSDLASMGRPSRVETEMEVLRSFRVARGAAQVLIGVEPHVQALPIDTDAEPRMYSALAREVHAYRPLEVLLRSFGRGREPVRIHVKTSTLVPEGTFHSYDFLFDPDGGGLTVTATRDGRSETERVEALQWGRPFQAHGRTFVIQKPGGDVAGRSYDVVVESVEVAADRLFAGVHVKPVGRWTNMVEIGCTASTPQEAQEGASALADSYLALRDLRTKSDFSTSQTWLDKEIKRLLADLGPYETELDSYISQKKAVLLSEQATSILERQLQLRTRLIELARERSHESWRLDRLKNGKEGNLERQVVLLGTEGTNAMVDSLFDRHAGLKRVRAALVHDGDTVDSPRILFKDAEIKAVREELERILLLALENRIADQSRLIQGLDEQIESLNSESQEKAHQLSALPELERGLAQRQSKVDRTHALLERYTEKQMELKSASTTGTRAATLVDRARRPLSRMSPSLVRMALLGGLLGLLAAVGLAFFLEALDRKVRNPQELEDGTGLTVYTSIPAFRSILGRLRGRVKTGLVTVERPHSTITESYRTLRANVRFANEDKPVRTLAITSALPQEGKTTTTCNLAVVLAQAGSRTLVVDADLRRPSTHEVFGGSRAPGLADVLSDGASWRDLVAKTRVEDLSVLYAGRPASNPGALLDSPAFAQLLGELKEAYDYVLFDVPPVLAVADAAAFFRSLDGVLLLNRYGRCTIDVVDGAREQIERLGGNLLGVVFNAFDARKAARGGDGYYGYQGYYGYGQKKDKSTPAPKPARAKKPESSTRSKQAARKARPSSRKGKR